MTQRCLCDALNRSQAFEGGLGGRARSPFHLQQLASLFFGLFSFGQISGDFGDTDQVSIVIAERRDDDVCPEPGAVLTQAPTFFFPASFISGDTELIIRLPASDLVWWIEDRKVLPNDLLMGIALYSRGTFVPAQDVAVRVEEEDGVVDDAGDEKSKE